MTVKRRNRKINWLKRNLNVEHAEIAALLK